jgi:hypothetical protein
MMALRAREDDENGVEWGDDEQQSSVSRWEKRFYSVPFPE